MITALGMDCIGFDIPSIESYVCDGPVYRKLLSGNCIIIELIDHSDIEEGDDGMIAIHQHLKGPDGSPARVVLTGIDGER